MVALVFGLFYLLALVMIMVAHIIATGNYTRSLRRWGDEEPAFFGCINQMARNTVSGWLLDHREEHRPGPIVVSAHLHGRQIARTILAVRPAAGAWQSFTLRFDSPVTESDLLSERVVLWARDGHLVRPIVMDAMLQRALIRTIR